MKHKWMRFAITLAAVAIGVVHVLRPAWVIDGITALLLIVAQAGVPRAAFVNARAAIESAFEASYLVADPAEYRARGARARVVEIFEQERLGRRVGVSSHERPSNGFSGISMISVFF